MLLFLLLGLWSCPGGPTLSQTLLLALLHVVHDGDDVVASLHGGGVDLADLLAGKDVVSKQQRPRRRPRRCLEARSKILNSESNYPASDLSSQNKLRHTSVQPPHKKPNGRHNIAMKLQIGIRYFISKFTNGITIQNFLSERKGSQHHVNTNVNLPPTE